MGFFFEVCIFLRGNTRRKPKYNVFIDYQFSWTIWFFFLSHSHRCYQTKADSNHGKTTVNIKLKLVNNCSIILLRLITEGTRCETFPRLTIKITTPMASFWYLYCLLWTYFPPCSSVSIVNLEHVIAGGLTALLQQDHLYIN